MNIYIDRAIHISPYIKMDVQYYREGNRLFVRAGVMVRTIIEDIIPYIVVEEREALEEAEEAARARRRRRRRQRRVRQEVRARLERATRQLFR